MQRGSVLPLLLIIILVVVLGGAGLYLYQSSAKTTRPLPLATSLPAEDSIPTVATANQVVFDDLLGLKFEIPKGYSLKKETEEEYFKRANGPIRKNFNYYVLYSPAEFAEAFYVLPESEDNLDKAVLTVWVFQNPEDLDPEKFYGKYWYYPFVWGDFTAAKNKIAPADIELIDSKEGKFGIVDYRDGKPKFIYTLLRDKKLMLQIQYPDGNVTAKEILQSFKFN